MAATSAQSKLGGVRFAQARRASSGRSGSSERLLLVGAIVAFVAMTVWWVTRDDRVQDWDNGLHTVDALTIRSALLTGHLTAWFTDYNTYPPFGHLVGAVGMLVGGIHPGSVILAENVVFVPLLALSCYGVGKAAFGTSLAGSLAAVFALGTPMLVSEMHEFLLDPQEASMVAAAVWGLVACRQFERPGIAALAGVAGGLAMLTKQTAIFFFVGLGVSLFVRGGWRNWRGVVAYCVAIAIVAGPWYVYHLAQLHGEANGAATTAGWVPAGATTTSGRFTVLSLTYYFWDALNIQLLAPLAALLAVGVLSALRGCFPRPRRNDLRFDLLVGCFVGWLGVGVFLIDKDPRYSLPALIYFAVLGTGWIATARRRWRPALAGVVIAIAAINFLGVSTGTGGVVQTSLPGHTPGTIERELTFYSPNGWLRGGPGSDGHIPSMMAGLFRAGIRHVIWDGPSTDDEDFNQSGLNVRAIEAGLTVEQLAPNGVLAPHTAYILGHVPLPDDPPPCRRLDDGTGVYAVLGDADVPFETYTFICPGRRPAIYKRTAPLAPDVAAAVEPTLPAPWRQRFLKLFRAMRTQGVREVQVDYASSDVPFFAGVQTLALASSVGLQSEQFNPGTRDNEEAFLVRHADGAGEPRPCLRFSDGTGLYIVLGYAYIPFDQYDFYCPTAAKRHYTAAGA